METFTPFVQEEPTAVVRLSEIETNLFRNYEESCVDIKEIKQERLLSFLRIRPIELYSSNDSSQCLHIQPSEQSKQAAENRMNTKLVAFPPLISQTFKNTKGQKRDVKQRVFEFNRIFNEETSQQSVYELAVSPLIKQFVQSNENVLLFAYGTTCSGKTHTIRGTPHEPGVIPRAIVQVFDSIHGNILSIPTVKRTKFNDYQRLSEDEIQQELNVRQSILEQTNGPETSQWIQSLQILSSSNEQLIDKSQLDNVLIQPVLNKSTQYVAWVSFVELYNESLIDLLQPENTKNELRPQTAGLKLVRDSNQNFFVAGLRHVFVTSAEEAHKVMSYGIVNLKKHMSSTGMNLNSSRSHAVFSISLIGLSTCGRFIVQSVSTLSLADLAGTERGKKTGNVGARMKEAGSILKSLFTLKNCISTLRNNQRVQNSNIVPYTESALTKLFQPFLSGFGTTTMVIAINPAPEHYDETIGTLEFSAIASKVVIVKDEERRKIREDLNRRLTQIWLQSSKNWSTICKNQNNDFSRFHKSSELSTALSYNQTSLNEQVELDYSQPMEEDGGEPDLSYLDEEDEDVEEEITADHQNESELDLDEIDDVEELRSLLMGMQVKLDQCQASYYEMELRLKVEHTKLLTQHDHELRAELERVHQDNLEAQKKIFNQKMDWIKSDYEEQINNLTKKLNRSKTKLINKDEDMNRLKETYKKLLKQAGRMAFEQQIEDTMMDIMNRLDYEFEIDELKEQACVMSSTLSDLKSLLNQKNQTSFYNTSLADSNNIQSNQSKLLNSEMNDSLNCQEITPKCVSLFTTCRQQPLTGKKGVRLPGLSTPVPTNFWNDFERDEFSIENINSTNSIQWFEPNSIKSVNSSKPASNSIINTPNVFARSMSSSLVEKPIEKCDTYSDKEESVCIVKQTKETATSPLSTSMFYHDKSCMTEEQEEVRKVLQIEALLNIREESYNQLMIKYKESINELNQYKSERAALKKETVSNVQMDADSSTVNTVVPNTPSLSRYKRLQQFTSEKKQNKKTKNDARSLCNQYLATIKKRSPTTTKKTTKNTELDDVCEFVSQFEENQKLENRNGLADWNAQGKSVRKKLHFGRDNSFVAATDDAILPTTAVENNRRLRTRRKINYNI